MFLLLLLVIVVCGGLFQYLRANGCGYSCHRRLGDGARAGGNCLCVCATCPCSPLDGVIQELQSIPGTTYQYCNLAYEWMFKPRNPRLTDERERNPQISARRLSVSTFEISPSFTELNVQRRRASAPEVGRTSTSRPQSAAASNNCEQIRRNALPPSPALAEPISEYDLYEEPSNYCVTSLLYRLMKILTLLMGVLVIFVFPLGKIENRCSCVKDCHINVYCILCEVYVTLLNFIQWLTGLVDAIFTNLEKPTHLVIDEISAARSEDVSAPDKEVNTEVDKVIEDEITTKLSRDLAQSIEKKFHVDLEKSVNLVLTKIHMLLQNGTAHILDRLGVLQAQLEDIRKSTGTELDKCLKQYENDTAQLAEKAMHQMVVCGYALIGHNPSSAVSAVVSMKNMIRTRLNPIRNQVKELDELLKLCGHEHDSLKKVIQCVIAKSPIIKSAMMDVTNQLLHGVVELTKVLAHGAMHEACLIEVIKTIEDEAFGIVNKARNCAFGNITEEVNKYIEENNATVLDIPPKKKNKIKIDKNKTEVVEMKSLIRRMLSDNNSKDLDKRFKKKLLKLQNVLSSGESNMNLNDTANLKLNNTANVNFNDTAKVNLNDKLLNSSLLANEILR